MGPYGPAIEFDGVRDALFLIYDLKKRRTTFYPGVPEYRRKNVARNLGYEEGQGVFLLPPDFWLWELDVKSGVMQRTQQRNILSNGYLHGMVTRDGNTYLLTNRGGNLYCFDVGAPMRVPEVGRAASSVHLPIRGSTAGTGDKTQLLSLTAAR